MLLAFNSVNGFAYAMVLFSGLCLLILGSCCIRPITSHATQITTSSHWPGRICIMGEHGNHPYSAGTYEIWDGSRIERILLAGARPGFIPFVERCRVWDGCSMNTLAFTMFQTPAGSIELVLVGVLERSDPSSEYSLDLELVSADGEKHEFRFDWKVSSGDKVA